MRCCLSVDLPGRTLKRFCEERRVLPNTCFSIEPGIYLPEFGIRSEVDVYIDGAGNVHVTGGPPTEVLSVLREY